ncbi:MAG TPA: hypothetical protein EYN31_07380 [Candidatus Marinimicrobia bacterium]|nr:hypothetical protein [Candidatus Neomarinimicrobiota bacterium]
MGDELSDELIEALKSDPNGNSFLLPLLFKMKVAMDHEELIKEITEKFCQSTGTDEEYVQKTYDDVIGPCLRSSCSANTKQHSVYQFLNNVPVEEGRPYKAQLDLLAILNVGVIDHSGMTAIIEGSNQFLEMKSSSSFHEPRHNYVRFLLARAWKQYAESEGAAYFDNATELMQLSKNKGYAATGILCTDKKFMNIELYDRSDMLEALEVFLAKLEAPELKKAIGVQYALAISVARNPIRNPELNRVLKSFWGDSLSDPERNHALNEADGILGGIMNSTDGSGSTGRRGSGKLA